MASSHFCVAEELAERAIAEACVEWSTSRWKPTLWIPTTFHGRFQNVLLEEQNDRRFDFRLMGGYNLAFRKACKEVSSLIDEEKRQFEDLREEITARKVEALEKVRLLIRLADAHEIIANLSKVFNDDYLELFVILLESKALQSAYEFKYIRRRLFEDSARWSSQQIKVKPLLENVKSSLRTREDLITAFTIWVNAQNSEGVVMDELRRCGGGRLGFYQPISVGDYKVVEDNDSERRHSCPFEIVLK